MGYLSAGPLPLFAALEEGDFMRVPDLALKCVVFLGKMGASGYVSYGTGFLVSRTEAEMVLAYLVTTEHVLSLINSDTIYVRINRISGDAEILPTKRSNWLGHPNPGRRLVDVAVCQVNYQPDYRDVRHIPLTEDIVLTDKAMAEEDIGIGDQTFTVGLFTRYAETKRNVPIVRFGNISAMPGEPIHTGSKYVDAYLIETRSIGGLSGSPMFVQLPPYRSKEVSNTEHAITESRRPFYLLGMMQGYLRTANSEDGFKEKESSPSAEENTGIAIVVPIQKIIETVDQPEFSNCRAEWIHRKRKEIGYAPASI